MIKLLNRNLILNKAMLLFACIFTILVYFNVEQITNQMYESKYFSLRLRQIMVSGDRKQLFCIVLTTPKSFENKTKVAFNTWVKKCDNYKFISVIPTEFGGREIANESIEVKLHNKITILQPTGLRKESYKTLTDKIFFTIIDIYKRYNDYEWYLKADDDTFIFNNNLRDFLDKNDYTEAVQYGYDFKGDFQSGGAGYLLSQAALLRIGSTLANNYTFCKNTGAEDVDLAKCLRKLNVYSKDSCDEQGRERFHPLNIRNHYYGIYPEWMYKIGKTPLRNVNF